MQATTSGEQTVLVMPDDSTDLDQSTTLTIVLQDENETDDSSPIRFEIEAQEGQELGPIVAQLAGLQQSGQLQQLVKMEGTIERNLRQEIFYGITSYQRHLY